MCVYKIYFMLNKIIKEVMMTKTTRKCVQIFDVKGSYREKSVLFFFVIFTDV